MPNPKLNTDISVNLANQNRIQIHDCTSTQSMACRKCKLWFNKTIPALPISDIKMCWTSATNSRWSKQRQMFWPGPLFWCRESVHPQSDHKNSALQNQRNDAINMIQHSGDSALFGCVKMEQDDITVAGKGSCHFQFVGIFLREDRSTILSQLQSVIACLSPC